ncbi:MULTISPECIES: hypothetical protein [unclassified Exiguobacterium]|uniref:hypothetical protein n=1 Tax=unclassified Exiguobacterium TaxID=2644629 RepID=UPI000DF821B9|nr:MULTISPECIES: hypothetical protein [unclassified Exiguobacterium]MDX1259483.1 hypothetical protein [Exiguobacterium sp. K1]RDB33086.1 hypothetical protein DVG79_00045 [Exiguobacterium sp. RIT594]HCN57735.1 hypothetical protein [Exiguobacterium sp.]
MKLTKLIGVGTVIWAVIFLIDYIYELFQINETSVVTTMTGLKISTVMTKEELNTHFSLTLQALLMYLAFIVLFTLFGLFMQTRRISARHDS